MKKTKSGKRMQRPKKGMTQDAKDKDMQGKLPFPLTNPSIAREVGELVIGASLEAERRGMKLSDILEEHDEKWLKEQRRKK